MNFSNTQKNHERFTWQLIYILTSVGEAIPLECFLFFKFSKKFTLHYMFLKVFFESIQTLSMNFNKKTVRKSFMAEGSKAKSKLVLKGKKTVCGTRSGRILGNCT